MSEKNHRKFKTIAGFLEKQKDAILDDWEHEMLTTEEKFSRLSTFSRKKFLDHMPLFLDKLIQDFRGEKSGEKKPAKKHGEERWENGLDLPQVTKEWSMLHNVLIEHVTSCFNNNYDIDSIRQIQKILARNIHRGIKKSVSTFYQLETQKAEAQLRDLNEVLKKREKKVKSHKNGLRQTSHDLKGNLLSLQIAVSLLQDHKFEDENISDIVNEMELATEGLDQLINELLNLFRLEAGHTELKITSFDVARELYELCESIQQMAVKEGLDLQCSGDEPLHILGDQQKVRRIAQNLLLNALKYTTEGKVEIHWEKKDEEQWLLTVSDTGPGLSKTHASSLSIKADSEESSGSSDFDAGLQNCHGEGIGLLIVRELSQLMNGIIEITTAPGEGTTFRVMLPVDISKEG